MILAYLRWACVAALLAVPLYIVHLQDSREEALQEAAQATARASRLEDTRAADTVATEALLQSTTKTQVVTREIIREVLVRIPADACPLPADWRVLHDAAAAGQTPGAPAGPDGPASGTQAAAR